MQKNNSNVIKVEKNAQKGAVFANVRLYFLGLAVLHHFEHVINNYY
jgi:hypothetical protein